MFSAGKGQYLRNPFQYRKNILHWYSVNVCFDSHKNGGKVLTVKKVRLTSNCFQIRFKL